MKQHRQQSAGSTSRDAARAAAGGLGPWCSALLRVAKRFDLQHDTSWAEQIAHTIYTGNEQRAKQLCEYLTPAVLAEELYADPFRSTESDRDGALTLGACADGSALGLDPRDLTQNVLCVGRSGAGKSTVSTNVLLQCCERGIPALAIDPKADYACLAPQVIVVPCHRLRFNPLCPMSTSVPLREHLHWATGTFSETSNVMQRGRGLYRRAMDLTYEAFDCYRRWSAWDWQSMRFPTLRDFHEILTSREFAKRIPAGIGKQSLFGLIDKTEDQLLSLGSIVECERGFDFTRLCAERRVVSLTVDALSSEHVTYLTLVLLGGFYNYFRTHGPRGNLNILFAIDEARHLIGRNSDDMPVVRTLLSQVREMGVGIWANEQNPAGVADAWWSNVGTVVALPLSNARDTRTVYSAIGATREQEEAAFQLQPGESIVKTARLRQLHRISVPFTQRTKFVAPRDLERIMSAGLADLDRDVVRRRAQPQPSDKHEAITDPQAFHGGPALDARERAFVQAAADHPDWPLTKLYRTINLTASSGHAVRARLEKQGFIRVVRTNLGKNRSSMLITVIDHDLAETLGVEIGAGRGRLHHSFWQDALRTEAETLGWRATIEGGQGGVGAADVLIEKDGRRGAVEVAVTSKPTQEVGHIETDLEKLHCDFLVMTFLSTQALERTRELAQERYGSLLPRTRFCLVTEFAATLGGV